MIYSSKAGEGENRPQALHIPTEFISQLNTIYPVPFGIGFSFVIYLPYIVLSYFVEVLF